MNTWTWWSFALQIGFGILIGNLLVRVLDALLAMGRKEG